MTTPTPLDGIGARPIPEFEGVHDVWPRGKRLQAVRLWPVRSTLQHGGLHYGTIIRPRAR